MPFDDDGLDRDAIANFMSNLQAEFAKYPISVAVEPDAPVPGTVNHYYAPVFQTVGDHAQVVMTNNGRMVQNTVTSGYEQVAELVAQISQRLPDLQLGGADLDAARDTAAQVLEQVTEAEPSRSRLRNGLATLRMFLRVALVAGLTDEVSTWVQWCIDQLGNALG